MLEQLAAGHYRVQGSLDMRDSAGLLSQLLALADASAPPVLVLDVSALQADSLLLAATLELMRRLQQSGGRLQLSGLAEGMRGLARVYGIDTLIEPCLAES